MRDEIKEFKKSRIAEEALKLFYERGFEATTLDRLASELGVTKPFIYSYYENKRSILEALHEKSASRVYGYIKDAIEAEGPPEERLWRFIVSFVQENIDYQIASGVYLQEEKSLSPGSLEKIRSIERAFNKQLVRLIQEGTDSGAFKVSDPKLVSLSISGMVRWVHRWYKPDGRLSAEDIAKGIADLGMNLVGYDRNHSIRTP